LGHWPAYIYAMFGWRISIFGKKVISLGSVRAPGEASARQQAIEFYSIPPGQQFRVLAVKIEEAEKAKAAYSRWRWCWSLG
jgi:hypothetical protein